MARMIKEVVALLNRLIQLDHDAIEACKAAMDRVAQGDGINRIDAVVGRIGEHDAAD